MSEWIVILESGDARAALVWSLDQGPIMNDSGQRLLTEKQVERIGSLKIEVFSDEHPPPHFRVIYNGETANYAIADCSQLNGGLRKFRRNIVQWHADNKQVLIDAWNKSRPTGCPVGEYVEPAS
jgi:hypothetical protein